MIELPEIETIRRDLERDCVGKKIKSVEVLRDGASAQYGSDAIAGVINFNLNDNSEGGFLEYRYGQYGEGDGEQSYLMGNYGLPMGDGGFFNTSFEYGSHCFL